jgi:hypothetical protein
MIKTLKNLNWKRIIPILIGAGGVVESLGGTLPPWVAVVGAYIAGGVTPLERIVAKRKKPASPFDSVDSAAKVERMR